MSYFKDNLKILRTAESLTQPQLAEKLRVTYKNISQWECGISEPSIPQLIQLSEIFGVTLDELIKEKQ
ncbi:MAG: helix-turn-helix domain-containing protein [Firmicutes bacterium]|nr:helix-turn-helix domain-containing protein [Bacillota bacterium]